MLLRSRRVITGGDSDGMYAINLDLHFGVFICCNDNNIDFDFVYNVKPSGGLKRKQAEEEAAAAAEYERHEARKKRFLEREEAVMDEKDLRMRMRREVTHNDFNPLLYGSRAEAVQELIRRRKLAGKDSDPLGTFCHCHPKTCCWNRKYDSESDTETFPEPDPKLHQVSDTVIGNTLPWNLFSSDSEDEGK